MISEKKTDWSGYLLFIRSGFVFFHFQFCISFSISIFSFLFLFLVLTSVIYHHRSNSLKPGNNKLIDQSIVRIVVSAFSILHSDFWLFLQMEIEIIEKLNFMLSVETVEGFFIHFLFWIKENRKIERKRNMATMIIMIGGIIYIEKAYELRYNNLVIVIDAIINQKLRTTNTNHEIHATEDENLDDPCWVTWEKIIFVFHLLQIDHKLAVSAFWIYSHVRFF